MQENWKTYSKLSLEGLINSYSQVFFSNDRILAVVLLLVSFFDLGAGLSGVLAILFGQLTALMFNFNRELVRDGSYTYNGLMVGLAVGVFYQFNLSLVMLIFVSSLLTFFLTIWFSVNLGKKNLPFLSIPFLLVTWMVILGAENFSALELNVKAEFSLNTWFPDIFSAFTEWVGWLPFSNAFKLYFRSLGAIFFQYNDLAGFIIAIAILCASRIGFSLSLYGFLIGFAFYKFFEGDFSQLIYSYIGFNFILTAIALGGFFVVPSRRSYTLLLFTIPIIALLISSLHVLFQYFGLPLYSLPFNIVVLLFITAMWTRTKSTGLNLVVAQQFSPELNHYKFQNQIDRFSAYTGINISLPIMGEWHVPQGYEGNITHKGNFKYALDFDIKDLNGNTYRYPGLDVKDYYCYDLPVIAPSAGYVVILEDGIEDNKIGDVDLDKNWGNAIVIKHAEGLYSKLSHIKQGSFRVKVGDYVQKGQIIGHCGSSGRSPEPHLHFQLQATPYIGSETMKYPISYFLTKEEGNNYQLHHYSIPEEGAIVTNVGTTNILKKAFEWIPGKVMNWEWTESGVVKKESWMVSTDAWNKTYLYCKETQSTAYFINDGTMLYFTDFYGDTSGLLWKFTLGVHKVLLGYYKDVAVKDQPLMHHLFPQWMMSLHDFIAPFKHFLRADFEMKFGAVDDETQPDQMTLISKIDAKAFEKSVRQFQGELKLENESIKTFSWLGEQLKIEAICNMQ